MDMSGNFDPIKFASVVRKAQGGRSQRAFATDCKISIPRMNLMLNGKIDQAPTQRTLQKIADHAQNGVTLNELIMATTTTDSDKETTEANYMPSLPLLEDSTRDRYAGLLLLAIQRKGCNARPLLGLTRPSLHPFNPGILTCAIDNAPVDLWQFRFIPDMPAKTSSLQHPLEIFCQYLRCDFGYIAYNNYYSLMLINPECEPIRSTQDIDIGTKTIKFSTPKVSFVVTSEDTFSSLQYFGSYSSFNLLMSVILIDPDKFYVIKETYLRTGIKSDEYEQCDAISF